MAKQPGPTTGRFPTYEPAKGEALKPAQSVVLNADYSALERLVIAHALSDKAFVERVKQEFPTLQRKPMSFKNVQLLATVTEDHVNELGSCPVTRPATPEEINEDACLWSVYIGEPGGFSWLADFADRIDAEFFANHLCHLHNATLIEGEA